MCGIIISSCKNTKQNQERLRSLLIESQIRGMHSTGISFIDNSNSLKTIKYNIKSREFVEKYWDEFLNQTSQVEMIRFLGHTRYSTSTEGIPQPIFNSNSSLVLNGVITQMDPEHWKDEFGFEFETGNDTEILLNWLSENLNIKSLHDKYKFSCSYGLLTSDKITHMRTNDRPSYMWISSENDIFISSTYEIMRRSGIGEAQLIFPGKLIEIHPDNSLSFSQIIDFDRDLQS